jgi:CheY-like chemotaxis protein/HPt (histidine-containing phosphotransfer) domain-containing protein
LLQGETGQLHLRSVHIDLPSILEDIAHLTSEQAAKKNLRIVTLFDSAVPVMVKGDPDLLHQLFMDLAGYAIKCADHGVISIQARVQKELTSPLSVDFSISFISTDAFAGRLPTIQKRLEDASDSPVPEFGGADSELFICRQLLKQMGSTIRLIHIPEKESRIGFAIKFELEPQVTINEPALEFKGIRILVFDHDPTSRQILTKMLSAMGCFVKSVSSEPEIRPALVRGMITNLPFRVALLDMEMPHSSGVSVLQSLRQDDQIKNTNVIVLLPAERPKSSDTISQMEGINSLQKPVQSHELHDALASILGLRQEVPHEHNSIMAERVGGTRSASKLRILLVDDDDLNLKMGNIVLNHLGHAVELANSGEQAVGKVESQEFDLVFMDVQMPHMNGLEATRQIRALNNNRNNIPIIAMTASDTTRYEKICLEAGMDDYLSKPFNVNRINQIIAAYAAGDYGKGLKPTPSLKAAAPQDVSVVLDVSVGMSIFDNDIKQLEEFLREFLKGLGNRLEKMDVALNEKDWESLGNEAHNLKGISANLGAVKVSTLAARLEARARERTEELIHSSFQDLRGAISELVDLFPGLLSTFKDSMVKI